MYLDMYKYKACLSNLRTLVDRLLDERSIPHHHHCRLSLLLEPEPINHDQTLQSLQLCVASRIRPIYNLFRVGAVVSTWKPRDVHACDDVCSLDCQPACLAS